MISKEAGLDPDPHISMISRRSGDLSVEPEQMKQPAPGWVRIAIRRHVAR
jgi:hypothetical protein